MIDAATAVNLAGDSQIWEMFPRVRCPGPFVSRIVDFGKAYGAVDLCSLGTFARLMNIWQRSTFARCGFIFGCQLDVFTGEAGASHSQKTAERDDKRVVSRLSNGGYTPQWGRRPYRTACDVPIPKCMATTAARMAKKWQGISE